MIQLNIDGKKDLNPLLGEDTWELFEVIEDAFGVDLGDYNAVCGMTLREIAGAIFKKANYPVEEKCLSAIAFYRLRSAFETQLELPRVRIRPTTIVSDLLPRKNRSARWLMLQQQVGLIFPGLQLPGWLLWSSIFGPPALLICLRWLVGLQISAGWIISGSFLLISLIFARIIPAVDARIHIARLVPESCATFGGLVKVVLARNYAFFATEGGSSCDRGVLSALRQLTAMQSGVELEKISPETRIPQDLNIY